MMSMRERGALRERLGRVMLGAVGPDVANEIREMRMQLGDCFPDERAYILNDVADREIVLAVDRHLCSLREWADGGDPAEADALHVALVAIAERDR